MPGDAIRLGIDYAQLTGDAESIGIGGISHNITEQAILAFVEPRRNLHIYLLELAIAPAAPELLDVPSLLGRDILHRWRMVYDYSKRRLAFHVILADHTVPLTPP
ncbi:MAG TPA: hypothetical protein VII06_30320 [Chloroflexota bacterium]|jgi:hypothetical protein